MPWVISYFELEGEDHLGDIDIKQVPVEVLRKIFEESDDESMIGASYPINEERASRLKEVLELKEELALDKYAYFLECQSDS